MKPKKQSSRRVTRNTQLDRQMEMYAAENRRITAKIGKFLQSDIDKRLLVSLLTSKPKASRGSAIFRIPPVFYDRDVVLYGGDIDGPKPVLLAPSHVPKPIPRPKRACFSQEGSFTGVFGADAHHPEQPPYAFYRDCRTSDGMISLQLKSGRFIAYEANPLGAYLYDGVVQTFGGLSWVTGHNATSQNCLQIPDLGKGVFFNDPTNSTLLRIQAWIFTMIFFRASSEEFDLSDVFRWMPIYDRFYCMGEDKTELSMQGEFILSESFPIPPKANEITIKVIAGLALSRSHIPPAKDPSGIVAVNFTDPYVEGLMFGIPGVTWNNELNYSAGGIQIKSVKLCINA